VKIKGDTIYNHNGYVELEADQVFNSYLWNNNTTLKTNHFPAKNLGPPGVYIIQLIASYNSNCKDTANVNLTILPSSNINQLNASPLQIFPNPSDAQITIKINKAGPIEIHNINGQLLLNTHIHEGENTLNLENFKPGIYFLKFEGKAYKLVIQK
ncbi:MAG: T9SS type A sorting domain-containing protein, partial [Candidatus Paceibacterota bacterium]